MNTTVTYNMTHFTFNAAGTLLNATDATFDSRAAMHAVAINHIVDYMQDCEASPRTLRIIDQRTPEGARWSFRRIPEYDVIATHYLDRGTFEIVLDSGERHLFEMEPEYHDDE